MVKPPCQRFSHFAFYQERFVNRRKQMILIYSRPSGNRNLFWLVPPTAKSGRHHRHKTTTRRNTKAKSTNPSDDTRPPTSAYPLVHFLGTAHND